MIRNRIDISAIDWGQAGPIAEGSLYTTERLGLPPLQRLYLALLAAQRVDRLYLHQNFGRGLRRPPDQSDLLQYSTQIWEEVEPQRFVSLRNFDGTFTRIPWKSLPIKKIATLPAPEQETKTQEEE